MEATINGLGDMAVHDPTDPIDSREHPLNRNKVADEYLLQLEKTKKSDFKEYRERLPSFKKRTEILQKVQDHEVVIVCGETGSGKTTQVPQYLMEDMIQREMGTIFKAIVTQPRRISAISVAKRVAQERGEDLDNYKGDAVESVGYATRDGYYFPRSYCSITYCTTGILLNKLRDNSTLSDVSHVILDEVHERDLHMDTLINLMRLLLEKRHIKIVLMSASINAKKFAEYFEKALNNRTIFLKGLKKNCPIVEIPGRLFEITTLNYLEQIVDRWIHESNGKVDQATRINQRELSDYQAKYGVTQGRFLWNLENQENINHELIATIVKHLHKTKPMGKKAILVFVSGWADLQTLADLLGEEYTVDDDYNSYYLGTNAKILLLHSEIKIKEQEMVHQEFPGQRKIILSTNIAEASITIEDVAFVVDSGKANVSKYDCVTKHTMLEPEWISKANVKQRLGRAARVQTGEYWCLYTKKRFDLMKDFPEPESKRRSLEEIVLSVKSVIGNDKEPRLTTFFAAMMDPPQVPAVVNAVELLKKIGAMDSKENLTLLGQVLDYLPVHPYWGKLCITGVAMGCLDPILSIASMMIERDPFDNRRKNIVKVDKIRLEFAQRSESDHLMKAFVLKAYEDQLENNDDASFWCSEKFLDQQRLDTALKTKRDLVTRMYRMKLINKKNSKAKEYNANSRNMSVSRNCLVYTFFPENFCVLLPGKVGHTFPTGLTVLGKKCFVGKKSVNKNFTSGILRPGYQHGSKMVFFDAMENKKRNLQMRDTTVYDSHDAKINAIVEKYLQDHKQKMKKSYDDKRSEVKSSNGYTSIFSPF